MAAGSFTLYDNVVLAISDGGINLGSDTLVLTLHTTSYTPAVSTDATWANVSASELTTANGYTAGGVSLSKTNTLASGTVTFTASAATWSSFSATFRYGVITRRAGASLASTDKLVCYCDLGGGSSVTGGGGTLTITPNASGIFTISHTP